MADVWGGGLALINLISGLLIRRLVDREVRGCGDKYMYISTVHSRLRMLLLNLVLV